MFEYIINANHKVTIDDNDILDGTQVVDAICFANEALRRLDRETRNFDINIFEALGLRNLSALVGEYFAKSVERNSEGKLTSNLHQDGYPDLLLVDTEEKYGYFESLYMVEDSRKYPYRKQDFSPFKYGGIEIKATCGSTPTATEAVPKPLIGQQRIRLLNGFDWKAHHRETNNLLAIMWDFILEVPTIVACFYRNDLSENDWGRIVQPREGGGRTTSVSIMTSGGVSKMCKGWITVIDDNLYTSKLSEKKWIGIDVSA
jgi:hypothetical protein